MRRPGLPHPPYSANCGRGDPPQSSGPSAGREPMNAKLDPSGATVAPCETERSSLAAYRLSVRPVCGSTRIIAPPVGMKIDFPSRAHVGRPADGASFSRRTAPPDVFMTKRLQSLPVMRLNAISLPFGDQAG